MTARGYFSFSVADYDKEIGVFGGRCAALTAGNFAAQNAALFALTTALQDATLGSVQMIRIGNENPQSLDPASDRFSQRELKWLVAYHDTTSLISRAFTIPCAAASLLDPDHRPYAKLADGGAIAALVAALQAFYLSPTGGAIVIDSIKLVGRAV